MSADKRWLRHGTLSLVGEIERRDIEIEHLRTALTLAKSERDAAVRGLRDLIGERHEAVADDTRCEVIEMRR
jgi:hypothetical protein